MCNPFWVIGLFLFSLFVRLLYGFFFQSPLLGDGVEYHRLALSLLEGKGFVTANGHPTSSYPPLQPILFLISYTLFGVQDLPLRCIQAGIGAGTVIFLVRLGSFFGGGNFLAGLIAALYVPFLTYASYYWSLSENLFLFFLVGGTTFLLTLSHKPSLWRSLGAGLFFGLASLTRSIALPLSFLGAGWLLWEGHRQEKRLFRWALLLLFFFCLTVFPWTLRNYRVHHAWVPVSTDGGHVFWLGNHFSEKGVGFGNPAEEEKIVQRASSEVEVNRLYVQENIRFIRENPGKFLKFSILKFLWFWYPFDGETHHLGTRYNYWYGILLTLSLFGMGRRRRKWREDLLFYLLIFYFTAMAIVFYGQPRFRLPIEPLLIVFASLGILEIKSHWNSWRIKTGLGLLFGIHGALLFCAGPLKELGKKLLGGLF
ncbi:MAG: glycosyltransferase family 39 protein [Candidatus Omnitrophica bacterium]|nr:glycosyltransferase family 39 protein [Candidatus Omnitrophota bacterium]